MQQRTMGGTDSMGQMPDPFNAPTEFLLAFLNRISVLDKEGFFQRPVREEEAPNYYSIIKQPMCFVDMREKISAGAYQTWRQLREDFNLIHENAKKFNSNKTLVHRAALNLQKKGTQILAQYELQVRKALAVLHPLGAEQPAGQAPASDASGMAGDTRMDVAASPTTNASMSGAALLPEQNGDVPGLDGGCQRPSMSGPPSPEGLDAGSLPMTGSALGLGQVQQSLPPVLIPPAPRDSIVGYISDEEDQPLLLVGTDAAAATAASAASRSVRGLGPSHALPLDALLAQLRSTAARVTYSFPGRRKNQEGLKEACSGGAGAGMKVSADARPSMATAASKEWQKARRPVELKARWLELRMRELRGQQERLQAQINWLQQRKVAGDDGLAGAALAAGMGRPAVGVLVAAASLAAAPCASEREALSSAAAEFLSACRVSSSLYFRLRTLSSLSQGPAAANPTSAGASISAASSAGTSGARPQTGANALPPGFAPDGVVSPRGGSDSRTPPAGSDPDTSELRSAMPPPQLPPPGQAQQTFLGQQQQQPQGPGRSAAAQQPLPLLPQQMPPCDEAESDKMLPGAIFASLDLLEQRLSVVRMRLQDAYKFDANRLVVGRTQGSYASRAPSYQLGSSGSLAAPGAAAAAGGPSAGQGAVKRQSSGQGRRPGGLTVLTRFDSMSMPSCKSTGGGGGKRKRSEIELLTGDIGTPLTSYGRTSLDRSASVTTIVIPPIRELAPDEFRARIVAATTWSQHYHTIGPSALGSVPPEIHSVLRKRRRRGLCGSGEDFEEEMAMGGLGGNRSLPGASDDEGGGAPLTSGMGGPMSCYSDSGIGDDEGSSTSSEDTSDEAYAARHRIMEEEEHRRYAAVVAEGQRRRNKGGSNASSSQQNQVGGPSGSTAGGSGSASQAKERAKVGNKTPRFSSTFKLKEGLTLVPPELPPDGPDMILPSATYGYYQPYQPPMVGVTTASALPPTPGSTPAAVLAHPQPVVVQQAVAQRTSSPPAMLHASPSGMAGQALQQRPPLAAATMATGLPSTSTLAGSGRPPVPPPQPPPTSQQSMQLPSPHSHVTQSPHPAGGLMERAVAPVMTGAQLVAPQQTSQTQEPPEPAQVQAPAQSQPQPLARAHGQGQAQQQASQITKPVEEKQQRLPVAASRQQEKPANVPVLQQQQLQQEQQQPDGQQQQQPDGQHVQVSQPAAAPQQQDGPDAAQPAAATGSKAKVTVESTAASSQSETVTSANVTGSEAAAVQPLGAAAAPKPASPAPPEPATARGQPQPQGSAAGQHNAKITTDAVTVAATAGSGNTVTNAVPTAAAPATASGAAEAHVAAAAAAAASGTGGGTVASVLAGSSVTQAQQVAMSVGASALLGSQAAAAMIAQSPAMSLQYLTSMQGLGAGAGTGGSNSTLSAAATSILLAAAAAASAGGQSAANNLMGNARTSALQQLAAGAPAAQVFANAAAAAAAAAAAGSSAGGGAGAGLGGLGQHGKQQSLFAAAGVSAARGLPAQNPLTTAATMSGIGGLGGLAGLPAAFQSLQGFPQSLAGFNLNLAGSGNLGLGLQHATQRLPDGLAGLGVLPQGVQHLQAHHLQGVPAPAPRQGQQMGQAEGGRGVGRPRRASRTAPIVDEEDEEWEDDEEEEEEAASPNARTRRSTRAQRRGSNGMRGTDIHGNGGPEAATRQPKRRAAKGAHNWAVLLASDSSDEEDGDEEWAARAGRRPTEAGGRVRGRGRRSAG